MILLYLHIYILQQICIPSQIKKIYFCFELKPIWENVLESTKKRNLGNVCDSV